MLECVVNISEGRDTARIAAIAATAGADLLDVHSDPDHHRSVLTLRGEDAPRAVASATVALVDLREHAGVHPRLGAVDVVPFVALDGSEPADARAARDRFSTWFATTHHVPCFHYGPERSLPDVRREAFTTLAPDVGPPVPHPTAGATAVGVRPVLVAYNVWLAAPEIALARRIAGAIRGDAVRALGLEVGERVQVSMNLVDPDRVGPADAYDRVARIAADSGVDLAGAELVGLIPARVLAAVPATRWRELDLAEDRTIEARMAR